jgi:hypothetical protein
MDNLQFNPEESHWWDDSSPESPTEHSSNNSAIPIGDVAGEPDNDAEDERSFLLPVPGRNHPDRELWVHAQAIRDFPNALDPEEWYRYPPIEAGAPKRFNQTRLGKLPQEVRHILYDMITDYETKINLFIPHEISTRTRRQRYRGLWDLHYFLRGLERIMGVCQGLRTELQDHLMTSTTHVCECPLKLGLICQVYGGDSMKLIRNLKMSIEDHYKLRPRTHFSNLLEILSKDLPNLVRFQFRSCYNYDDPRFTEHETSISDYPTTTRDQQEIRALLQFGAFLVLRHKNLDLLIWPADSSMTGGELWDGRPGMYIDIISKSFTRPFMKAPQEIAVDGHDLAPVEVSSLSSLKIQSTNNNQDRILNATKIRHTPWKDIAAMGIDAFTIDRTCNSSEVPEGHRCFKRVDMEAYITETRREDLGDPEYIPVDGLIRMGQKHLQNLQSRQERLIKGPGNTSQPPNNHSGSRQRPQPRGRGLGYRGNTSKPIQEVDANTPGHHGQGSYLNAHQRSRRGGGFGRGSGGPSRRGGRGGGGIG